MTGVMERHKLSKEEMSALMGDGPPRGEAPPSRRVEPYDFFEPRRFKQSELEYIRKLNATFAQDASRAASRMLRDNVKVTFVGMDQMKWESFLGELSDGVSAFSFSMPPMDYEGVVVLDSGFLMKAVDRLLGGAMDEEDVPGELAGAEVAVAVHFVKQMFSSLPVHWKGIGEFRFEVGGMLEDIHGAGMFAAGENMFQVAFLAETSSATGNVYMVVPFEAVRSLPPSEEEEEEGESAEEAAAVLEERLLSTEVDVILLLGRTELTVGDLLNLEVGDVVLLDTAPGDALDVQVCDKVKLKGIPGVFKGKRAFKLTGG